MITDSEMNIYELVTAIHAQQLIENNGHIDESRYFWKIGENVARKLRAMPIDRTCGNYLFGIQIKYDIINPDNLQLFKDVTI